MELGLQMQPTSQQKRLIHTEAPSARATRQGDPSAPKSSVKQSIAMRRVTEERVYAESMMLSTSRVRVLVPREEAGKDQDVQPGKEGGHPAATHAGASVASRCMCVHRAEFA